MPTERTVQFTKKKTTTNTVRYDETPDPGQPPVVGSLYLKSWFAGDTEHVEIVVRLK